MAHSQLDVGVAITETYGAISLVTQYSGAAGHSMIAIEYLNGEQVENVVAHLVALPNSKPAQKLSQTDLKRGQTSGSLLKTRILIQREGTAREKTLAKFPGRSRTWAASNSRLNDALARIGIDASLTDTSNPAKSDTYAADWATSPDTYSFYGKLSVFDPGFGRNCANWAVSVLESAGVRNAGGYLLDVPRSLTRSGILQAKL